MDIKLKKQRSFRSVWLSLGIVMLAGLAVASSQYESVPEVQLSALSVLPVEQGPLNLSTQAFGALYSVEEVMLTAQARGKVTAIYVRPGAAVTPDTVVLALDNMDLSQQLADAEANLASHKADLQSFIHQQRNDRLDSQGNIADTEAQLEKARLNLEVYRELAERGVSAKLEILRAELDVKQLAKKLEFDQEKFGLFVKMQALQLQKQQIELQQYEQQVSLLTRQVANLQVKAGIQGTLQSLDVELGQNVPMGESLGKVGSDQALVARLRVPQQQADQIALGAGVLVETRKGNMKGLVNRIESVVTNGNVLAEVSLEGPLPADARPATQVNAHILKRVLPQALYVEQAAGLGADTQLERFVIDVNGQVSKRTIAFGDSSRGKLVVLSGLKMHEQLIAQMPKDWANFSTIQIINE